MPAETRDETPTFVAYDSCGHMVFATVDNPASKRETAREVAQIIKQGLRVEKMAVSDVRAAKWCPADCPRRRGGIA